MKTALYASALCLALVATAAQAESAGNTAANGALAANEDHYVNTNSERPWYEDPALQNSPSKVTREQVLKELEEAKKAGNYVGSPERAFNF